MTNPAIHEITASEEDARQRVDMVLVRHLGGISRSKIQSLIKSGRITLRGESVRSSDEVHAGDIFKIEEEPSKPPQGARPEDIPIEILYEDEDLLVVNKPDRHR